MFTVTLNSAGCLPDSDFYPAVFETARDAWEFVASEVEMIDDDETYLEAHTALHIVDRTGEGSIPAGGLYAYHVERVVACPYCDESVRHDDSCPFA